MTIPLSQYGLVEIKDIKPYENNARIHSIAQINQLRKSIRRFGFTNPILLDEDFNLIAGHGRVEAAKSLAMTELPAMIVPGLDEKGRRALILADNKLAENAGWDDALLRNELEFLMGENQDMDEIGFSDADLADLFPDENDGNGKDDDVPALPNVATSRATDVWLLGKHRVLCGDSTSVADLKKLMAGEQADMVWTDPPYNLNYEGVAGKIKNDSMGNDEFYTFLCMFYAAAFEVMKPGAAIYVAHADTEGLNFRAAFHSVGFKLSGCLVWRKPSLVLGRSDYQWQHEPILYGWKPGAAHNWYGKRNKTTMQEFTDLGAHTKPDGSLLLNYNGMVLHITGDNLAITETETSLLTIEKPSRSSEHPTMKPVELIERHLRNSSKAADIVLDSFGGSGSTLIACEKIGRCARLIELDEKFVDVIVRRWEEFTGLQATHESDGRTFTEITKDRNNAT